ncbi:MAG: sigma-70 family RNA polymerase sigma factor [Acidobacteriota bacterium]
MERREERDLVRRTAAGDRQAAERLLEATYAQTFAALAKMAGGDRDVAADLTQETYRRAWKAFASFDGRARFATWLYRIAYMTFLNHLRKRRPVELVEEDQAERLPAGHEGLDARAVRREEAALLRRAVLELPEALRFTVTARYWAEMEVEEIAAAEEVTGAAIRKRLKTATARLRGILEEVPI